MSKTKKTKNNSYRYDVTNDPVKFLLGAVLGIVMGIIFIVSQSANKPIEYDEAFAYSGSFDYYDTSTENYCEIHFEDDSVYYVYPHTESSEFRGKMNSLEKGTKLYILVNPNNEYVVEIKTETEELLNFEISQQEIDSYDNGYIGIGIFAIACAVFLIIYAVILIKHRRKESTCHDTKKVMGDNSAILRYADSAVKSRILLEATAGIYEICYRRVKSVNELVVNGRVYDEMKAVIEFEHKLCAVIDGHKIEVGYDDESYSYIMFDGKTIKRKKRWI